MRLATFNMGKMDRRVGIYSHCLNQNEALSSYPLLSIGTSST